jgi:hypothetical protein
MSSVQRLTVHSFASEAFVCHYCAISWICAHKPIRPIYAPFRNNYREWPLFASNEANYPAYKTRFIDLELVGYST